MAKVVAVRKDEQDRIYAFKLDDGRELDYPSCMEAIHNGELPELVCTLGRPDNFGFQPTIIRSQADGDPTNNLSRLPEF